MKCIEKVRAKKSARMAVKQGERDMAIWLRGQQAYLDTAESVVTQAKNAVPLRDQFAMAALQGTLAGNKHIEIKAASIDAYALADSMLEVRDD